MKSMKLIAELEKRSIRRWLQPRRARNGLSAKKVIGSESPNERKASIKAVALQQKSEVRSQSSLLQKLVRNEKEETSLATFVYDSRSSPKLAAVRVRGSALEICTKCHKSLMAACAQKHKGSCERWLLVSAQSF